MINNINIYISDISSSAGTERATTNLANNLCNAGYEVKIVSIFSKKGESYFPVEQKIEIIHLGCKISKSLLVRLFNTLKVNTKIKKTIINTKAIYIGTDHFINILLTINSFFFKDRKYIGCEHLSYGAATNLTTFIRKIFYKYLNALVVLTDDDLKSYKELDGLNNSHIIPNQISFYPQETADCNSKNLLAIGRLSNQKGFDLMLTAVAPVLNKFQDWKLIIVGEGEMEESLLLKIEELEMKDSIIIEPFTKDIISKYLNASIYLMTSRHEGFPMVLLEAKACGLPIISYDCPTGPKDLINDNDGYLIPMNDSDSFRLKLEFMIENQSLINEMGKNARVNVLKYSPENILKKWKSLIYKI